MATEFAEGGKALLSDEVLNVLVVPLLPRADRDRQAAIKCSLHMLMNWISAEQLLLVVTKISTHGDANIQIGKPASHGGIPIVRPPVEMVVRGQTIPAPEVTRYHGAAAEYTVTEKLIGTAGPALPNTNQCTGAAWTIGPCQIRVRIPDDTGLQAK